MKYLRFVFFALLVSFFIFIVVTQRVKFYFAGDGFVYAYGFPFVWYVSDVITLGAIFVMRNFILCCIFYLFVGSIFVYVLNQIFLKRYSSALVNRLNIIFFILSIIFGFLYSGNFMNSYVGEVPSGFERVQSSAEIFFGPFYR